MNKYADLISVIVTTFNGERYLAEAIDSILSQEDVTLELVIVNDGSTDNTVQIIDRYTAPIVIVVHQSNQGHGAALNRALTCARGEYIAFLDHDDLFLPAKLFHQLEVLKQRPEIDIVLGYVEHFISPELPDEIKAKRCCPAEPMKGGLTPTGLFRRHCFEKVGPFNPAWKVGTHTDWMIRAKEYNLQEYCPPEVIARRRIHDQNQSILQRNHYSHYIEIIKNKLDRERALYE